jgi:hypothetical protein
MYLLLLLLLLHLLSQDFSSWHFSSTSGEPHRSGFKFQTAVLSLFCDVPSIALFCSDSTECFPGMASHFLKTFCYYFTGSSYYCMVIRLVFHISCTSIQYVNVYFSLFSAYHHHHHSLSTLCKVFTLRYLKQTIFLSKTVLRLFCSYYSWSCN